MVDSVIMLCHGFAPLLSRGVSIQPRPDLFNQFEDIADARVFPMRKIQRCAATVCKVCDALSDSDEKTVSSTNREGAAVLICHRESSDDKMKLVEALCDLPGDVIVKIVTRKTQTAHDLSGTKTKDCPKIRYRPINHLHKAVKGGCCVDPNKHAAKDIDSL